MPPHTALKCPALTPGIFRDIEDDWIALTGPTADELWHRNNGVWTRAQTLGTAGVGMLMDGNQLVRTTGNGVIETWALTGTTWTQRSTQTLASGNLTAFDAGGLLIENLADPRDGQGGYGSF